MLFLLSFFVLLVPRVASAQITNAEGDAGTLERRRGDCGIARGEAASPSAFVLALTCIALLAHRRRRIT